MKRKLEFCLKKSESLLTVEFSYDKLLIVLKRKTVNEFFTKYGVLAQLGRALRWQRRGHRFEPDILH